jgi:hypothetical protein
MNFIEAMKALRKDKKVRRAAWEKNFAWSLGKVIGDSKCNFIDDTRYKGGTVVRLEDVFAEDWEIERPKPKPMTFLEAIDYLKEHGGKVKRPSRLGRICLECDLVTLDHPTHNARLHIDDYQADDWIPAEDENAHN